MAKSFGSMSLHLGADARVTCDTYPDKPNTGPILSVNIPGTWLNLAPSRNGGMDAGDLRVAHELAEAVAVYVAECERLHAENAENDQADPSQAPAA